MQNDFEKEVRQKMDELKFVPTEPVWSKIEAQIQTRKDKRRLILWLPFLLLVLAAAGWMLVKQLAPQQDNQHSGEQLVQEEKSFQEHRSAGQDDEKGELNTAEKQPTKETAAPDLISNNTKDPLETAPPVQESNRFHVAANVPVKRTPVREQEAVANHRSNTIVAERVQPVEGFAEPLQPQSTIQTEINHQSTAHLVIPPAQISMEDIRERPITGNRNIVKDKVDSAAVQAAVVQTAKPKWKLAILLQGGISGVGEGFLFSRADMTPAFATPPPVTNADIRPSIQSEGMHLAAGIAVKRSISKRLEFQTGLQYSYYSHKLLVAKDSFVGIPSGGVTTPQQVRTQPHTNRFHFIAIPVELHWQLLKQAPLHLSGGVTVQQLLKTNALVYKGPGNRYTSGDDRIRKTQLMAGLGINYAFRLKKGSLQVGPQLQYAMNSFEKDKNNRQLYALGLKAQFTF